ncbi:MAG: hypothetical protein WBD34_24910 [Burkholderiaceae bacterium]
MSSDNANLLRKIALIRQVAFMKQARRRRRTAGLQQRWMASERALLLLRSANGQPPTEQAGSADLCDRGQGSQPDHRPLNAFRNQLVPAKPLGLLKELAEYRQAESIDHQQQNRMRCCQGGEYAFDHRFQRDNPAVAGRRLAVALLQHVGK